MYTYNAAWLSLAIVLTGLCAVLTFLGWRWRGLSALLFGLAWTLLPMALYLTGAMRVAFRMFDELAVFVTGFAFSPKVWLGIALGLCSLALYVASRTVKRRQGPASAQATKRASTSGSPAGPGLAPGSGARPAPVVDDDLADIEAILKSRGIT